MHLLHKQYLGKSNTSQNIHSVLIWNNFTCSFPTVWGQFPNAPLKEVCAELLSSPAELSVRSASCIFKIKIKTSCFTFSTGHFI